MEKKNRRFLLQNKRSVRWKDASLDLPSRSISAFPPRRETEDQLSEQPPSWEVQWQEFLERVKSQEMLEEGDIWQEAKDLLAAFEQKTKSRTHLGVPPLELRSWLAKCSLQTYCQALDLAEAFLWRKQEMWRQGKQVVSGSSSSIVQKSPSDEQEEDVELSHLERMSDSENESEHAKESTVLDLSVRPRKQEGKSIEDQMDPSMPSQGGALQEQEREDTNSGEKPFSCPQCSKSFSLKTNLDKHLRIHTAEKLYICSDCGNGFRQKQHLVQHQRSHTGEKPYVCSDCGNSFKQKEHLNQHKIIHTGVKPHKCPVCGKAFTRKEHLFHHQIIHKGEKPK